VLRVQTTVTTLGACNVSSFSTYTSLSESKKKAYRCNSREYPTIYPKKPKVSRGSTPGFQFNRHNFIVFTVKSSQSSLAQDITRAVTRFKDPGPTGLWRSKSQHGRKNVALLTIFIWASDGDACGRRLKRSENTPQNRQKHRYSVTELASKTNGNAGTSSVDWAQHSRFYLRTVTDTRLRNVDFAVRHSETEIMLLVINSFRLCKKVSSLNVISFLGELIKTGNWNNHFLVV
jgi:hypothetical protein